MNIETDVLTKVLEGFENRFKHLQSRINAIETHLVNLIVPIQEISTVFSHSSIMDELISFMKQPLKIDDSHLKSSLDAFIILISEFNSCIKKMESPAEFIQELRYISSRSKHISENLDKLCEIQNKPDTKEINLSFSCDGYQLVKKPLNYDFAEPIAPSCNDHVVKMLDSLSKREALVITHRYGLMGHTKKTFKAMEEIIAVTRERIRLIEAKAIRKLRAPTRSDLVRATKHALLIKDVLGQ